jgi:hypothetical protein
MFRQVAAALIVSTCAVTGGSAATIFADDFNRAQDNTVGNGWTEHEKNAAAVRINHTGGANGFGFLELTKEASTAPDASVVGGAFSTLGFTNISVSFLYKGAPGGNHPGENLYFAWGTTAATGTTTPTAGFFSDNSGLAQDNWLTATISLGGAASNLAAIYLSLFTNVDSMSAGYEIRNFALTGDAHSDVPGPGETPLPAAVFLFGTVLAGGAGFGAIRRRRKAAA